VSRAGRADAAALVLALLTAVVATGCASSSPGPAQPPTAKMERMGNAAVASVVLTPLGAARIGLRTAAATAGPAVGRGRADVIVPYSALLYEPDGATAVYVDTGGLVYTRYLITVDTIDGDLVYLKAGALPVGAKVVTVGAEELLGVQSGVGVQT
jgi:hypothetical protein